MSLQQIRPGRPNTLAQNDSEQEREGTSGAWRLIAMREITVKLTDRAFLLGTLITVVLISGLLGLQAYLAQRTSTYHVVATADATAMANTLAAQAPRLNDKVEVDPSQVPDAAAARAALADSSADAWLHRDGDTWVLTTYSESRDSLESVARQVVQQEALKANATAAGTTLAELQKGATLQTQFLRGDAKQADLGKAVGFAFAMLFYMAILVFGYSLAGSVVEEKQSRIVEIIATAVPLRQLLAGKVLGNMALAVGQLALYVGIGLVGLAFTEYSTLLANVTAAAIWFVVFFIAGFGVLACLWAVAGSLASRTEDLQSTTTPLTIVTVAVFFSGLFASGIWLTVLSFVPPFSAVLMPLRLAQGSAPWWQAAVALVVLVVTAGATVLLGERLYRRSLLQTGSGPLSIRSAWTTPA